MGLNLLFTIVPYVMISPLKYVIQGLISAASLSQYYVLL